MSFGAADFELFDDVGYSFKSITVVLFRAKEIMSKTEKSQEAERMMESELTSIY
jgi:hypothetical protein